MSIFSKLFNYKDVDKNYAIIWVINYYLETLKNRGILCIRELNSDQVCQKASIYTDLCGVILQILSKDTRIYHYFGKQSSTSTMFCDTPTTNSTNSKV